MPTRRPSATPPPETESEKPTTSVEFKQSVHAILGNGLNTPLPILDPETGDLMKIVDKKKREQFKDNYYKEYGMMSEIASMIQYFTGMSLHELEEVATSKPANLPEIIAQTRKRILDFLSGNSEGKNPDSKYCFLRKYIPEERDRGLREMGRKADEYINDIISKFFPGYEHDLSLKNEVSPCRDAATLLFMIFDRTMDIRVRYEARRKLILMKMLGEIKDYGEDGLDHENALNYMIGFLNKRMIKLNQGEKTGIAFERFLISVHSTRTDKKKTEPDNETIDAEIRSKPIKKRKKDLPEEDAIQRITPISMRRAIVSDFDGNEREIFFYTIPREKNKFSRLTKTLRLNRKVGEKEDDRNGIRMVFEKKQDWVDFFERLKQNLKEDTMSVEIKDVKDNSDGLNGFEGVSESSNPDLKVLKFKLEITKMDESMQRFEFQIFLPDGFADYHYRRGVSWAEYQVNRFYDRQLDELLFPSQIFPELDREDTRKEATRRAFDQIWDRDAIELQEKKIGKKHVIDPE